MIPSMSCLLNASNKALRSSALSVIILSFGMSEGMAPPGAVKPSCKGRHGRDRKKRRGLDTPLPGDQHLFEVADQKVEGESEYADDEDTHDHGIAFQIPAALRTMKPRPLFAATISAATRVVQPTPIPMRMPVNISGRAAFMITWLMTCQRVAPIA